MSKKGILLLNLGSPDAPTIPAVKRYLREFLMDSHVVNTPWLIRYVLVNWLIVPFRSKNTAAAYQSIWPDTTKAAPLVQHTQALAKALETELGKDESYMVGAAMRYGNPGIEQAIRKMLNKGIEELLLLPQYPHHADSTRTTSIEAVNTVLSRLGANPKLKVLEPFYRSPTYISALAQTCKEHLPDNFDHLLFSFHGLPEQHILDADPVGNHCLSEGCCNRASPAHASCYRHQVYSTATLLAEALGLGETQYSVAFQSRLGRQQWLRPYTDQVLKELPDKNRINGPCKNIAVICPAFTADNLETLEEINIRGKEIFMQAGGAHFTPIPCLNQSPEYLRFLAQWCKQ